MTGMPYMNFLSKGLLVINEYDAFYYCTAIILLSYYSKF